MSTYQHVLSQVFPVCVSAPVILIRPAVALLMGRDDLLNGSSFAVTSRSTVGGDDYRGLWLSRASAEFLATSWYVPLELRTAIRAEMDRLAG